MAEASKAININYRDVCLFSLMFQCLSTTRKKRTIRSLSRFIKIATLLRPPARSLPPQCCHACSYVMGGPLCCLDNEQVLKEIKAVTKVVLTDAKSFRCNGSLKLWLMIPPDQVCGATLSFAGLSVFCILGRTEAGHDSLIWNNLISPAVLAMSLIRCYWASLLVWGGGLADVVHATLSMYCNVEVKLFTQWLFFFFSFVSSLLLRRDCEGGKIHSVKWALKKANVCFLIGGVYVLCSPWALLHVVGGIYCRHFTATGSLIQEAHTA